MPMRPSGTSMKLSRWPASEKTGKIPSRKGEVVAEVATIADLVGNFVIYRDLEPLDQALPRFRSAWKEMGLRSPTPPRKLEPAYAQAVAFFLRRAAKLAGRPPLAEIVYVGDTVLSDGNAFRNLCQAGGWPGWAFIGSEKAENAEIKQEDGLYKANCWALLPEFLEMAQKAGAKLNETTAVVLDVDKTLLGARGRNDRAIDLARTGAMEETISEVVGPSFDADAFTALYAELNVPRYHGFTADNQDYLAYTCMIVAAGGMTAPQLMDGVQSARIPSVIALMEQIEQDATPLPEAVAAAHRDVLRRVQTGDATPFKAFRRREYLRTVGIMGQLADDAPDAQRLSEEICLTREVFETTLYLTARGCLPMALSDKPDEAALPTKAMAKQGYLPLHRQKTHVVGTGDCFCLDEEVDL